MKWVVGHRLGVVVLGVALFAASYRPFGEQVESGLYHALARLMPAASEPVRASVIALDEAAFVAYGPWPWAPRRLDALLDALHAGGAAAIGLALPVQGAAQAAARLADNRLVLARPALAAVPRQGLLTSAGTQTASLLEELAATGQPWYAPLLRPPRTPWQLPQTPLAQLDPARAGVLPLAAEGERVWAEPLLVMANGVYLPSFALDLLARARGLAVQDAVITPVPSLDLVADGAVQTGVRLGDVDYATDAALRVYPQPAAAPIPVYAAQDLLAQRLPAGALRGKVVLLGITAPHLSYRLVAPGGRRVTPVEWQAWVVNSLLNGHRVRVPAWSQGVERAGLLLVLVYLLLLPRRLRGRGGLVGGALLALLMLNVSLLALVVKNTWLPLGLPALYLLLGQLVLAAQYGVAARLAAYRAQAEEAWRDLARELQAQGKLDQAFEALRQTHGEAAREDLYGLGLDYERRRQFGRALAAYDRIAAEDPAYRDIAARRARHGEAPAASPLTATTTALNATLVVDDPQIERPLLGRYEIERELGRGAMGTVYLGRDPRIGRTVAIKTLALSEAFESQQLAEVRRRFFQEAETAGRLSHPNIVTVFDAGEEHDLAYIAMDYVQGDSLDQHVHPDDLLPIPEVFAIGVQVAQALDYAHRQKVVHRDVKPGNILYDPQGGQLKVTDFGIACLTDHSKTRTGTVLGSPFYMSPEQIAGKRVDGRSDLYSLGVTLYQLLSGRLPFEGDSLPTLMYRIANERPKPIRKVRAELPTCVTRVINKALDKDPSRRFASGAAMAEAILRCAG